MKWSHNKQKPKQKETKAEIEHGRKHQKKVLTMLSSFQVSNIHRLDVKLVFVVFSLVSFVRSFSFKYERYTKQMIFPRIHSCSYALTDCQRRLCYDSSSQRRFAIDPEREGGNVDCTAVRQTTDGIDFESYLDGRDRQQSFSVWERLSEWFQGDFDNYAQVVSDRKQNLTPRDGGGHEHFHCTLVPVTESTRLAAFYFDGNPDRIFRFRFYELVPNGDAIYMMLNTLHPDLEKLLKAQATSPLEWARLFDDFLPTNPGESKVSLLEKCDISWSFERDVVQHSYLKDSPEADDPTDALHAIMNNGPTIVNSTIIPGMQIRIVDQLSLYPDVFYINDRGFDPITDKFIYGNQREVPYRLERVSTISPSNSTTVDKRQSLQRIIVNPQLEWTIGPDFRTEDDYDSKMRCIGGPSVGMNRKKE